MPQRLKQNGSRVLIFNILEWTTGYLGILKERKERCYEEPYEEAKETTKWQEGGRESPNTEISLRS